MVSCGHCGREWSGKRCVCMGRTKGLRNAGVAFANAKRGGPMRNPRDKRRAQKDRRYEAQAD